MIIFGYDSGERFKLNTQEDDRLRCEIYDEFRKFNKKNLLLKECSVEYWAECTRFFERVYLKRVQERLSELYPASRKKGLLGRVGGWFKKS